MKTTAHVVIKFTVSWLSPNMGSLYIISKSSTGQCLPKYGQCLPNTTIYRGWTSSLPPTYSGCNPIAKMIQSILAVHAKPHRVIIKGFPVHIRGCELIRAILPRIIPQGRIKMKESKVKKVPFPAVEKIPTEGKYLTKNSRINPKILIEKVEMKEYFVQRFGYEPEEIFFGPPNGSLIYAGPLTEEREFPELSVFDKPATIPHPLQPSLLGDK